MANVTQKIHFRGKIYHVKWFSGQKGECPRIAWAWTCCIPGWAWKPGWACTWSRPWPKKNFRIFFQKIKSTTFLVQHVNGQPDSSTYVREKGCIKKHTIRDTPCTIARNGSLYIYIYVKISFFGTIWGKLHRSWMILLDSGSCQSWRVCYNNNTVAESTSASGQFSF